MLVGTTESDKTMLATWMDKMMRFDKNSHLRGTCLLTGQQATVDMTSNYKTSMTPFSSVNVVFMLALVLWITASFALFYIGGAPKLTPIDQLSEDKGKLTSDDIFMGIAILWNVVLVLIVIVPDFQANANIPLNNVVIAVVALLVTIFVQWQWAHFHWYETDFIDANAAEATKQQDPTADLGFRQPIGGGNTDPQEVAVGPYDPEQGDPANNSRFSSGKGDFLFSTSNFLSTASAVKMYGAHQYNRLVDNNNNIRNRKGGGAYSSLPATGSKMARMPNYAAMVKTGSPIVIYNYMNNIKVAVMDALHTLLVVCFACTHAYSYTHACFTERAAQRLRSEHGVHHHHAPVLSHPAGICLVHCSYGHGAVALHVPSGVTHPVHPHPVPEPPVGQVQGLRVHVLSRERNQHQRGFASCGLRHAAGQRPHHQVAVHYHLVGLLHSGRAAEGICGVHGCAADLICSHGAACGGFWHVGCPQIHVLFECGQRVVHDIHSDQPYHQVCDWGHGSISCHEQGVPGVLV